MIGTQGFFRLKLLFKTKDGFDDFCEFYKSLNFGFNLEIKREEDANCFYIICEEYDQISSIFDVLVKNKNNLEKFHIDSALSFLLVTLFGGDDTGSINFECGRELLRDINSLGFCFAFTAC